jgi:transcriptional repressor NrdR
MVCSYCGSETEVVNSRPQKRSNSIWRRRKCLECGAIFSTTEHTDYEKTWVVQYPSSAGQAYSPFVRDKLFISIHRSLQHRPSALNDAIGLTETVINQIHKSVDNGSIKSTAIAQASYRTLKRFDRPAAISYQAFHTDVLA